jgi:hypothetical protein
LELGIVDASRPADINEKRAGLDLACRLALRERLQNVVREEKGHNPVAMGVITPGKRFAASFIYIGNDGASR